MEITITLPEDLINQIDEARTTPEITISRNQYIHSLIAFGMSMKPHEE